MRGLLLLVLLLLAGCVGPAISGANMVYRHKAVQDDVSDYSITIRSWNALKTNYPQESLRQLHLTSFHRILLVTGQVPNSEIRAQVEQTLKNIPKVLRVYNATTVGDVSTKEQVQDSWITAKIKSKMIASNELYADRIKVITEKNIVYLMGIITEGEGQAAIDIAKSTQGVQKVVTIFYYMTMPDIS